jgi:hypothetical protein
MRRIGMFGCALALGVLIGGSEPGRAAETGMASIHTWVRVGGKTCLADHFHNGSGSGNTRSQAERQAVQAWVDFTAWEYGSSWGRYHLAASKRMTCERGGERWTCQVEARPCRGR